MLISPLKLSFLPVFILLSFSNLLAQSNTSYAALRIPAGLTTNANDVVRLEDRKLNIESTKTGYLSYRKVVTILNEASRQNVLYTSYDQQSKIRKIRVTLYDAAGNFVRKIKESEIEDFSAVSNFSIYEDDRYKRIAVVHNTYPYTVEFEYELSVKGIALFGLANWYIQQYHSAVQQANYQIQLPKKLKIYYDALNFEGEPTVREVENRLVYTWKLKGLAAKVSEAFSPSAAYILPRLLVSLDQFEIDHYKGSFRSWKDFGRFVYDLSEERDQLSDLMREKIMTLTANASNDQEKIERLYQYLQQNMRYVSVQLGIGGWQPFDAAYVEKNKYGDCKALTNFMKAMLKAVDIVAYPVLIYNAQEPDYRLTEDFTTSMFNHVILRIPTEDIWLECTSTNFPVNYIGLGNANRTALMITEGGGQLVETPHYAALKNTAQNNVQIYLEENGGASIEGVAMLKGSKQESYRSIASNYSKEEFEEWYREKSALPSFQINRFSFESASDTPSFELQVNLTLQRYASATGKRLFVPINKITPLQSALKVYDNRTHPVVLHHGFTEDDHFEFHLPEGYGLESAPKADTKIESPFGSYSLQIEEKEGQVHIKRHLVLHPTEQPAAQYTALRDFFMAVAKCDAGKMVLVKKD